MQRCKANQKATCTPSGNSKAHAEGEPGGTTRAALGTTAMLLSVSSRALRYVSKYVRPANSSLIIMIKSEKKKEIFVLTDMTDNATIRQII